MRNLTVAYVTRIDSDRMIASIKAVRTVTGYGLREAKVEAERIRDYGFGIIPITQMGSSMAYDYLSPVATVEFRDIQLPDEDAIATRPSDQRILMDALGKMPPNLTVEEVLSVLDAV